MARLEIIGDAKLLRLNIKDNPYRLADRFLIAHVLGHYVLHCKPGADYIIVEERKEFQDSTKHFWLGVEQEAFSFANDLLLPLEVCRFVVEQFKDIEQPNEHFWFLDVSCG